MNVTVATTVDVPIHLLQDVLHLLNASEGPIRFDMVGEMPVEFDHDGFEFDAFFQACRQWRERMHRPDEEYLIVLTGLRNAPNWFSSIDPRGSRTAFLHTGDWEVFAGTGPTFPLATETVVNLFAMGLHEQYGERVLAEMVHIEPVGCVLDFCGWKPQVTFKLRTADICPDCQRAAGKAFEPAALMQLVGILEQARKGMVHHRLLGATTEAARDPIERLPVNVAVTWRRAQATLDQRASIGWACSHVDSLYRSLLTMILSVVVEERAMRADYLERLTDRVGGSMPEEVWRVAELVSEVLEQEELGDSIAQRFTQFELDAMHEAVEYAQTDLIPLLHQAMSHQVGNPIAVYTGLVTRSATLHQRLASVFKRYRPVRIISLLEGDDAEAGGESAPRQVVVEHLCGSTPYLEQERLPAPDGFGHPSGLLGRVFHVRQDHRTDHRSGVLRWFDANPFLVYEDGLHPLPERRYHLPGPDGLMSTAHFLELWMEAAQARKSDPE